MPPTFQGNPSCLCFSCKRSPMGLLCPLFLFGFRAEKKVNPNITGQLRYRSVDYGFRKMDKSGLDRICWWCLCQDARVQFCNDRLCIREDSMHVTTRSWHNPLGAFGCVAVKSALHMSSFQQCRLLVQMPERVAPPVVFCFSNGKPPNGRPASSRIEACEGVLLASLRQERPITGPPWEVLGFVPGGIYVNGMILSPPWFSGKVSCF